MSWGYALRKAHRHRSFIVDKTTRKHPVPWGHLPMRSARCWWALCWLAMVLMTAGCRQPLAGPAESGTRATPPIPADAQAVVALHGLAQTLPVATLLADNSNIFDPLTTTMLRSLSDRSSTKLKQSGLSLGRPAWFSVRPQGQRVLYLPLTDPARFRAVLRAALLTQKAHRQPVTAAVDAFLDEHEQPSLIALIDAEAAWLIPSPASALEGAIFLQALARGEGRRNPVDSDLPVATHPGEVVVTLREDPNILGDALVPLWSDAELTSLTLQIQHIGAHADIALRVRFSEQMTARLHRALEGGAARSARSCAEQRDALLWMRIPAGIEAFIGQTAAGPDAPSRLQGAVELAVYRGSDDTPWPSSSAAVAALLVGVPRDEEAAVALEALLRSEGGIEAPAPSSSQAHFVFPGTASDESGSARALVSPTLFGLALGDSPAWRRVEAGQAHCPQGGAPLALRLDAQALADAVSGSMPPRREDTSDTGQWMSVVSRLATRLAAVGTAFSMEGRFDGTTLSFQASARLQ